MVIERCSRALKGTQIKIMPLYYWASRQIEANIKVHLLGLLIERVAEFAELACGKLWHQIQGALGELQISKFFKVKNSIDFKNIFQA